MGSGNREVSSPLSSSDFLRGADHTTSHKDVNARQHDSKFESDDQLAINFVILSEVSRTNGLEERCFWFERWNLKMNLELDFHCH
jgi:hypothetical protein